MPSRAGGWGAAPGLAAAVALTLLLAEAVAPLPAAVAAAAAAAAASTATAAAAVRTAAGPARTVPMLARRMLLLPVPCTAGAVSEPVESSPAAESTTAPIGSRVEGGRLKWGCRGHAESADWVPGLAWLWEQDTG